MPLKKQSILIAEENNETNNKFLSKPSMIVGESLSNMIDDGDDTTIQIDETKSEVERKHSFKRSSLIAIKTITTFSNNFSKALHLTGSNNLVPNKIRYRLLTLNPEIYNHNKGNLVKILKDKRSLTNGNISMFEEIVTKYQAPVIN